MGSVAVSACTLRALRFVVGDAWQSRGWGFACCAWGGYARGMPTIEYMFKAFRPSGEVQPCTSLLSDAAAKNPHLISLIESLVRNLAEPSPTAKVVLSVDETSPVMAEFAPMGRSVGVAAYLTHGQVEAILVAMSPTRAADPATLDSVREQLARTYPNVNMTVPFEWLQSANPPRAALIYLNEVTPTPGVDTAAMCLSSAFFRLRNTPPRDYFEGD